MDNKTASIENLVELLLNDELILEIIMSGMSMYPVLKHGEVAIVQKCDSKDVHLGDILVFKRNDKYIAHRLMSIVHEEGKIMFKAKGDNNVFYDKPFNESDLIAKVIAKKSTNLNAEKIEINSSIRKKLTLSAPILTTYLNQFQLALLNRSQQFYRLINDLRKNLCLVNQASTKLFIINLIISFFQSIFPFALIYCFKYLIDILTQSGLPSTSNSFHIISLLFICCIVFIINGISSDLRSYWGEKLNFSISKYILQRVQRAHLLLSLTSFEDPKELDKLHRIVQESGYRPQKFINEVLLFVKSFISVLIIASIFLSIKWYLLVILTIAIVPTLFIRLKTAQKFKNLKDRQAPIEREMYYNNRILTAFPFAKEIRLFNFAGFFVDKFNILQNTLITEKISHRKKELIWNVLSFLVSAIIIFTSIAYIAYLKLQGLISIGSVALFFFVIQRGYSVLNDLFRSISQLLEDNSYLTDLNEFIVEEAYNEIHSNHTMTLKKSLRIEHLSFAYKNSTRSVLSNIDLEIPAGSTVAIVGENGSGKSTLIKLLCGFYMPNTGSIYYDKVSTLELGQKAISHNMAAVFQDFALYNVSAATNIGLGNIDENQEIKNIVNAAKDAGLHEIISELPQGYDTILGNSFIGGEELSIGQWQKLAVARAFYRNADMILLDEPTSALDVYAEQELMHALKKLAMKRTTIIVSHRLSSVKWVDKIILLHNGQLAGFGSHTELIENNLLYQKMYNQIAGK